jgi:ABC-type uncharacterized transport system permease subunit
MIGLRKIELNANPRMSILAVEQILTIILYIAATAILWRRLQLLRQDESDPGLRKPAAFVALIGLICHVTTVYPGLDTAGSLQLGLTAAGSVVAATVIALYLIAYLIRPIENLGLLLLPIAALAVAAHWGWPGVNVSITTTPLSTLHIAVSILAYGLLAIAASQSVLLLIQERLLRRHQPGGMMRALPPLLAVEQLMFQLIMIGFVLLTLTLISGIFFSEQVFGEAFKFSHHIVLSIAGWAVFAVLLLGRWRLGWRGKVASSWTLTGFGLLLLAYFGTKFVSEILLKRVG